MSTTDMEREKLGELLSAYLDGELNAQEVELVERVLQEDEDARRLLDELRRTVSLVSSLPRHAAPSSIADDVRLQLERSELLGDVPAPRAAPGSRRSPLMALLSMAAAVGFMVIGGLWILNDREERGAKLRERVVTTKPVEEGEEALGESDKAGAKSTAARKDMATRSSRKAGKKSKRRDPGALPRAERRTSRHRPKSTPSISTPRKPAIERREVVSESFIRPGGKGATTGSMADAAVEQKLAAGFEADAFRDHRFSNEAIRLRVPFTDETKRDAVAAKVAQYLAKQGAADLAEHKHRANRAASVGAVDSFYYRGKPGVNFARADERQILVRAPARELDGLLNELADAMDKKEDVSLFSGPNEVAARGFVEVRRALNSGAEPRERVAPATPSRSGVDRGAAALGSERTLGDESAASPTAARRGLLEVMRGLGLDSDRLRAPKESAGDRLAGEPADPLRPEQATADATGSATDRPDETAVTAQVKARDHGKTEDSHEQAQVVSAHREDEPSELKKSTSSRRSSLVERRAQALEEASRKRSSRRPTTPPPGTAVSPTGRYAGTDTKTGSSVTAFATGESAEADRYVTLVVELVASKPIPPRDTARSAKTNRTGNKGTTKTKRAPGKPAQR